MFNCIYDCRYCFLQGMYSSANYLIFVNFEDFDIAINKTIENNLNSKITFFSGYDCDSLALENVTGFAKHILKIFRIHSQIEIEFRTKSIQKEPFLSTKPMRNVILAYSLMPTLMSKSLDNKAPPISKRIKVISELASKGWKIGLRFDPLIYGANWKELYYELLVNIYNNISLDNLHSVSFGSLRFPKRMFKDIFRLYPNEPLFSSSLSLNNKMISYDIDIEEEMTSFCKNLSLKYINEDQIFKCSI
ncbi:DNA photolyase, partial [bacterium]|nr:DNA photolyase [bacterium]